MRASKTEPIVRVERQVRWLCKKLSRLVKREDAAEAAARARMQEPARAARSNRNLEDES